MVKLELVDGKKGDGDILVLVTANHEPLTFSEWLFIGKLYLDSEAKYYPISQGFSGKAMLLNALIELALDVDFFRVIQKYGLMRKTRKLEIEDKRGKMKG